MKKILLYAPMFDFIVEDVINKINDIPEDEDFLFEMNSPGGSVFAGWGLINALKEREGKFKLLVTGHAASMGFFTTLFFDDVEALDVTSFMIHRADGYAETDEQKELLKNVNSILRSKMEKKLDKQLFKDITGFTIKDIFESEERKDVWISAKQAKQIGLITKIRRIEPNEQLKMVAFFNPDSEETKRNEEVEKQQETISEVIKLINNFKF